MEEIAEISRVKPHKKWLVAGGALAVCLLLGLVWLARPQAAEEEPLRREYPVSRKDITVGIDAAGNIQSEQWGQFAPVTVTLKEYKVRVGDKVAERDAAKSAERQPSVSPTAGPRARTIMSRPTIRSTLFAGTTASPN